MKYYAIGLLNFISRDWAPDYLQKVTPLVEKVGGRYLARSPSVEVIEGNIETPHSVILIEFPSKEAAEEFYYSSEYEPYKISRQQGSVGQFLLVSGQDIARMKI